jgi:glycosyltransferase involved in cell wall biosynthesis
MTEPLRLLLVTDTFSNNQMGRVQSLDMAAHVMGHEVEVVTLQPGAMWAPLADSDLAARSSVLCHEEEVVLRARSADVVVAVKALPETVPLAVRAAKRAGRPILIDVDDADVEVRTISSARSYRSRLSHVGRILGSRRDYAIELVRTAVLARRLPTTVSNPVLQRRWGGTLVPHARPDRGAGRLHGQRPPSVAFVGTPWGHKGIHLLRTAVAALSDDGWTLTVTAPPPVDARPFERWIGQVSFPEGERITAEADVVCLPSEAWGYGAGQLPMKLVDAMLAGRAVAVSDTGPLPWAVGDAGLVFSSGNSAAVTNALRQLAHSGRRAELGNRARALALQRFTPEAVGPHLDAAVRGVLIAHAKTGI